MLSSAFGADIAHSMATASGCAGTSSGRISTGVWQLFTKSRDTVKSCQTPVLILPDDVPSHPYAVAMECAMLAPKAEVSMFPWKEPKERIPLAVRQVRSFLRAHRPT